MKYSEQKCSYAGDGRSQEKTIDQRPHFIGLSILALFSLLFLFTSCSSLLFFPSQNLSYTPLAAGLPYSERWFTSHSREASLHSWVLSPVGVRKGVVLFLHGNAGNIAEHLPGAAWLAEAGYEVVMLEYQGFGRSTGSPSYNEAVKDAQGVLRILNDEVRAENTPLFLFGQSMGGAIALAAAGQTTAPYLRGIIVDSAFSSLRGIIQEKLGELVLTWPLSWPIALMFDNSHSPELTLQNLGCVPILFISGSEDTIVPPHHSEILAQTARLSSHIEVEYAGHIQSLQLKGVRTQMLEWMKREGVETNSCPLSRAPAPPNPQNLGIKWILEPQD